MLKTKPLIIPPLKTVSFVVKFDQKRAFRVTITATLRYETKHNHIGTGMEPDAGSMRSIEKRRPLSRILAISPRFTLRAEDLRFAISDIEGCSTAGDSVPQRGQDW